MLELTEILPVFTLFVNLLSLVSAAVLFAFRDKPAWKYRKPATIASFVTTMVAFMLSVCVVMMQ
jgi:hypothetical protein